VKETYGLLSTAGLPRWTFQSAKFGRNSSDEVLIGPLRAFAKLQHEQSERERGAPTASQGPRFKVSKTGSEIFAGSRERSRVASIRVIDSSRLVALTFDGANSDSEQKSP